MSIETATTQPPPAKPPRQLTQAELRKRFPLSYNISPKTRAVTVPNHWIQSNLVRLTLPRAMGVAPCLIHRDALPVFAQWFALIEKAGLVNRLVTFNGSFVPRLKRGANVPADESGLSRHSRGIAIDFNATWNKMGTEGAKLGEIGCMQELVPLAHECGLVWGGDWKGASCDAMHLEVGVKAE
jgi:D-alanyl-D-alanine carboxypeptidase-like protein